MTSTTAQLNVKVNAKTAGAERNLKKLSQSTKSLFNSVGIASGISAAGYTMLIKKSAEAHFAQERAERKLETFAKNRGIADQKRIDGIKSYASELQKVGVIGDEVLLSGASQLLTFKGMDDVMVKKLLPSLADMAVNLKGVNANQDDLRTLADLVGKAFAGQAGALSRYGIKMTDAQSETLKTGTAMERMNVVLELLQENYNGLNEALAQTDEGKVAQMTNAWGDLLETIGKGTLSGSESSILNLKSAIEGLDFVLNTDLGQTMLGIGTHIIPPFTTAIGTAIGALTKGGWKKGMKVGGLVGLLYEVIALTGEAIGRLSRAVSEVRVHMGHTTDAQGRKVTLRDTETLTTRTRAILAREEMKDTFSGIWGDIAGAAQYLKTYWDEAARGVGFFMRGEQYQPRMTSSYYGANLPSNRYSGVAPAFGTPSGGGGGNAERQTQRSIEKGVYNGALKAFNKAIRNSDRQSAHRVIIRGSGID